MFNWHPKKPQVMVDENIVCNTNKLALNFYCLKEKKPALSLACLLYQNLPTK